MTTIDTKALAQQGLGDALRGYMHREGVTARQLAASLRISEQYVGKLAAGRGWPSPELLADLRAMGIVDVNALLDNAIGKAS